jgi:hypothetical protein
MEIDYAIARVNNMYFVSMYLMARIFILKVNIQVIVRLLEALIVHESLIVTHQYL